MENKFCVYPEYEEVLREILGIIDYHSGHRQNQKYAIEECLKKHFEIIMTEQVERYCKCSEQGHEMTNFKPTTMYICTRCNKEQKSIFIDNTHTTIFSVIKENR